MNNECDKCGEHALECKCPTELTLSYIDKVFSKLMNGDFDIKKRPCWKCSKDFLPNYDEMKCDECFFAQFPKEQVKEFCKSFFE